MEKRILFASDSWDESEWMYASSSLYTYRHPFVQHSNCVSNLIPDFEGANFPYISMLYKEPQTGVFTVTTDCYFESYGAPIIVVSGDPEVLPNGNLQYGEHFEVVVYENGINIWHLDFENGVRCALVRAKFPLEAREIHRLTVTVDVNEGKIIVSLRGHVAEYTVPCPALKTFKNVYAGITACEGTNRFYNFKLNK